MRDGLFEMVRDAAAGHAAAELRVEAARVLLSEAAALALTPCTTPPLPRIVDALTPESPPCTTTPSTDSAWSRTRNAS
jgi:hypothetical protein